MDSILTSIKKVLGISEEDISFDSDIIMNINAVLFTLNQLGVGPEVGFSITGKDELWSVFLADRKDIESVKTLVYLKVRLLFDPPSSAFVLEAIERQIAEFEWRLNTYVDKPIITEGGVV
jgi:hypothetical protein